MSENNNTDLNEVFEEEMDDATVITVPIDDTLSNSGEAADAAAVGAALALKADKDELPATIKVNGQQADNQGLILINGTHIPVSGTNQKTLAEAIEGITDKTAADIPMSTDTGAKTIGETIEEMQQTVEEHTEAIESLEGKTAEDILMEEDGQETVKEAIGKAVRSVNRRLPDTNGNVDLTVVPLAENLQTDRMQSIEGEFIERTTGGNGSVSDGKAYPQHIYGNSVREGYVAEDLQMTVIPIERTEPDEPITATIDRDTFVAYVDASGTYNLYYTTEWSEDPELYGVTVTGDPVAGDQIKIEYVKEVRGTIIAANPERLVATGWNLFNANTGYARVVKYSSEYGYKIGGGYTSIAFSTSLTGNRTSLLPNADGLFQVPADGYVFVTGGNNSDTYILATWSDWMEGPSTGYWEEYKESGIILSAVVGTYFPYGMLKVGNTYDEIDLAAKRAISRIERIAYSEENRAAAEASGRAYTFDESNIYIVRAASVQSAITISGEYTVSEHGIEFFTETELPLNTEILYGKNLRDKLERDVLTISAQVITAEEKKQVCKNTGAVLGPGNNGTNGQLLKTNGDGTTEWVTQGTPTDAQVGTAVSSWLDAHPEATTTVQDGSISRQKLNNDLKAKTDAVPGLQAGIVDINTNIADLPTMRAEISNIKIRKVNQPLDENNQPTDGVRGQSLRTNGNGTTEWADVGLPTDEQTEEAVSKWLDDHPEATTTVQDASLTETKFTNDLKLKTIKDYVTPEMFGAIGDGTTDDTDAIKDAVEYAIENGISNLVFFAKEYVVSEMIYIPYDMNVYGNCATIIIKGDIIAFGINTQDATTWVTEYPTKIGCVFKNFVFRNYDKTIYTNAKAIMIACGTVLEGIEGWEIECLIRQLPNHYVDNKEIRKIICRRMIGDNDIILGLGDGLVISDCMDVQFNINSCAGANIKSCINGSFYLEDCKAISIVGWHNELTVLKENTIKNSYVTFKSCSFFVKNEVSPLFVITQNNNNFGSLCVFEDCTFNLKTDFITDFTSLINDINISVNSKCVLKNTHRVYATTAGYGGAAGSLVVNGNEIHPLRCSDQIICDDGTFQKDNNINCIIKRDFVSIINQLSKKNDDSFETEIGTYYYSGNMLFDTKRLIGVRRYQTTPNEKSIIIDSIHSHPVIEYYGNWNMQLIPSGYFRFYRGTASRQYDKYIDVPINTPSGKINIIDNDVNFYNCLWENRTSGNVDGTNNTAVYKLKANGNVEIVADAPPVYGTWEKGDIVINQSPSAGSYIGWICVSSGTPGTWKGYGLIQS